VAHALQASISGRVRGADVLIHLEPEDAVRNPETPHEAPIVGA
jgi:hypothetical protein